MMRAAPYLRHCLFVMLVYAASASERAAGAEDNIMRQLENCLRRSLVRGEVQVWKYDEAESSGVAVKVSPRVEMLERLRELPMLDAASVRLTYSAPELGALLNYPGMRSRDTEVDVHSVATCIAGMCSAKRILMQFTPFDDAAVAQLAACPDLEALHLGGTLITDQSKQTISGFRSLVVLSLSDLEIGDSFVAGLEMHPSLRWLSIGGTRVSYAGVSRLCSSVALTHLYAHGLDVSKNEVALDSDSLLVLDLSYNDVRLLRLRNLPRLQEIFLINSDVNQSVVDDLLDLPSLQVVYANGCQLNDGDVAALIQRGIRVELSRTECSGARDRILDEMLSR